jgi:hypothetical protein
VIGTLGVWELMVTDHRTTLEHGDACGPYFNKST